ncbi:hypothetical protein N7456_010029 [Penicillium angulare]|uniref:Uncharacterized protein n=1 Tax=Penicillium angulare TaxID=116970 RepID=A0A9W9K5S0_9EURO|nr:hypothetical protein N7456_010029 [Penicillium angulare]
MSEASPDSPTHLEQPTKSTEVEEPGAEDTVLFRDLIRGYSGPKASNSDDDHFSDASEGHTNLQSSPQSGNTSPVPRTRVERVDNSAQHGEVPGTAAFEKRVQDAPPDEIEVVPEGAESKDQPVASSPDGATTPNDAPIPQTIVEKVDPDEPSFGEVPGTDAYEKRQADATPDVVKDISDSQNDIDAPASDDGSTDSNATPTQPIPVTKAAPMETIPIEDNISSSPQAQQPPTSDLDLDVVETINNDTEPTAQNDVEGDTEEADAADDFADDFDDFVDEQEAMEDDDFGDFDDGFQEPNADITEREASPQQSFAPPPVPPLTDFDVFKSTSDLLSSLQGTLDTLLPASKDLPSLQPIEPIPDSAAIFSTERSLSLWSQLVAPPPLQPQNWVKSRIRRLFLVSLGVPVDLDEILPASKQKKLILPSIDLESGTNTPAARSRSEARKEGDVAGADQESGTAPSGQGQGQGQVPRSKNRRGAPPVPMLDLPSVRRLCATTDAALGGLTDGELKGHVSELENVTLRASEVLEYWLKRRDGLVGEKEAFEGVIENLVSHVRRVRK